jgi:transposase InsO family protein
MREDGLRAKPRRRSRGTTNSAHAHPIAPNRLERRFAIREIEGVDRVWVGDITNVPRRESWLELAVVLDLASRRVVGWAIQFHRSSVSSSENSMPSTVGPSQ